MGDYLASCLLPSIFSPSVSEDIVDGAPPTHQGQSLHTTQTLHLRPQTALHNPPEIVFVEGKFLTCLSSGATCFWGPSLRPDSGRFHARPRSAQPQPRIPPRIRHTAEFQEV
jgi:hypothetical protein